MRDSQETEFLSNRLGQERSQQVQPKTKIENCSYAKQTLAITVCTGGGTSADGPLNPADFDLFCGVSTETSESPLNKRLRDIFSDSSFSDF